jgi:HSP20 family molecular chaperone IbpA
MIVFLLLGVCGIKSFRNGLHSRLSMSRKAELAAGKRSNEWGLSFPTVTNDLVRLIDDIASPTSILSPRSFNRPIGPLLDIKETKDSYQYIIDVPGVKKEDVKVEIRNHMLSLEMEKKDERKEDTDQYHRIERFSGYMHRTIPLPDNIKEGKICVFSV